MNQFKFLIKTMFIEDWGINGFSNKVEENMEKRKIKSILMVIIFMMSLFCYLVITYSVLLRKNLEIANRQDVLLKISNIIASLAICILSIYKGDNGFYNTNNSNILSSLPIAKWKIVLAKVGSLMIASYILVIICISPSAIIYYHYNYQEIYLVIYALVVFISSIFTPFLPITIGLFIGKVIKNFRGNRKKRGTGIIIFTIAFLVFMMILSMKVDNLLRVIISEGALITEKITVYYRSAEYFADAIGRFKVLQLLKYIGIQSIAAAALYKMVSRYFKNIT